jgi:hypothetical protein
VKVIVGVLLGLIIIYAFSFADTTHIVEWEYKVVIASGEGTEERLNEKAKGGWELVTAYDAGLYGTRYTFKRKKQ